MVEEAKKEEKIGRVTHYFGHVEAAAIELSGPLKVEIGRASCRERV